MPDQPAPLDPDQLRFALASRRFYRIAELIHCYLPGAFRLRAARLLGRWFSPYRADRPGVVLAFRLGLKQGLHQALLSWLQWRASHGLFGTGLFRYADLDLAWVGREVAVDDPELLGEMVKRGGLVLTYHSFHHNTLGIVLGLCGARVYGVAGTEKNSPFAPYTGRYVRIINGQSEAKFGGGRYLFTDEMRGLVRQCREAFAAGDVVVSLCDNPAPDDGNPPCRFLDRHLHVGTGILDLAVQAGAPVYFAIFYPDLQGGFRLRLGRGPLAAEGSGAIAQAYFRFLETCVGEAPWCWQGWAWYADLAPAHGDWVRDAEVKGLMLESIELVNSGALRAAWLLRKLSGGLRR